MADETSNYVLNFVVRTDQAVASAKRGIADIQAALRAGQAQIGKGSLDSSVVKKFGEDLRREMGGLKLNEALEPQLNQLRFAIGQGLSDIKLGLDSGPALRQVKELTEQITSMQHLMNMGGVEAPNRKVSSGADSLLGLGRNASLSDLGFSIGDVKSVPGLTQAMRRLAAELDEQITSIQATEAADDEMKKALKEAAAVLGGFRKDAQVIGNLNSSAEALEAVQRKAADAEVKRVESDNKAAAAAGERAKADEFAARSSRSTYANPDTSRSLGRAQEAYNQAELAVTQSLIRKQRVMSDENRTLEDVIAAERGHLAAVKALGAAESRVAIEEQRSGSLSQQFMSGFKGTSTSDRSYAEQVGQAFKFSILYGSAYNILFALTQTFKDALSQGIEFQQAVNQLALAAGQSVGSVQDWADQLGKTATAAGFSPQQGVQIGAQAIGLYGASQGSMDQKKYVSMLTAQVASKLAATSGGQAADIAGNLAAVSQAFGGGANAQVRTADLDAYMSRTFGIKPGTTVDALAQSATVGKAAGFSQEQVAAIAADVMSRTNSTSSSVGGYLAQIFSRGGEGSLTDVASKFGIDPTAKLSEQISRLAELYKNASGQDRTTIAAAFGRGKVQDAAIALLQDWDSVQRASNAASNGGANGAADKSFAMFMDTVGGHLKTLGGDFQEFENAFGKSGLLDVLGLGIQTLDEFLKAATGVLDIWNEFPRVGRDAIIALAALALAAKATAAAQEGSSVMALLRRGGGVAGGSLVSGGAAGLAEAEAGAAGAVGLRASLASAGTAIAGMNLAIPGAIAALVAIGVMKNSADKLHSAFDASSTALAAPGPSSSATSEEVSASAAALREAANSARQSGSGWLQHILDPSVFRQNQDNARSLDIEAKREDALAKQKAAQEAANARPSKLLTSFDSGALSSALDKITQNGGSAAERMDLLARSLKGTAVAADTVTSKIDPNFAANNAKGLQDSLTKAFAGTGFFGAGKGLAHEISATSLQNALEKRVGQRAPADVLKNLSSISDQVLSDTGGDLFSAIGDTEKDGYFKKGTLDKTKAALKDAIQKYLQGNLLKTARQIMGQLTLSDSDLNAVISEFQSDLSTSLGHRQGVDVAGKIRDVRRTIKDVRIAVEKHGGQTPQSLQELDDLELQLSGFIFNELENDRRAAQSHAKNAKQVAAIGRSYLTKELRSAIKKGDGDTLAQIISQAGSAAIGLAKSMLEEEKRAYAAWKAAQVQVTATTNATIAELAAQAGSKTPPPDPSPLLQALKHTPSATGTADVYKTGSDVPGYTKPPKVKDTSNTKDNTVDTAKYLLDKDVTNPIAQAKAAVQAALAQLKADSGKDAKIRHQDLLDVKQSKASLQDAQFQTRLNDIQTQEQLGKITEQRYMNYLKSEHNRLERVKHRTYQQQEELNQIDQLMKDAATAMDGQWNFGDIKLPTAYQVRAYATQAARDATAGYRAGVPSLVAPGGGNTTIYINGADTGHVKRVIAEAVGQPTRVLTNRSRYQ